MPRKATWKDRLMLDRYEDTCKFLDYLSEKADRIDKAVLIIDVKDVIKNIMTRQGLPTARGKKKK